MCVGGVASTSGREWGGQKMSDKKWSSFDSARNPQATKKDAKVGRHSCRISINAIRKRRSNRDSDRLDVPWLRVPGQQSIAARERWSKRGHKMGKKWLYPHARSQPRSTCGRLRQHTSHRRLCCCPRRLCCGGSRRGAPQTRLKNGGTLRNTPHHRHAACSRPPTAPSRFKFPPPKESREFSHAFSSDKTGATTRPRDATSEAPLACPPRPAPTGRTSASAEESRVQPPN
jgi:hypothetical protein